MTLNSAKTTAGTALRGDTDSSGDAIILSVRGDLERRQPI